MGNDPAPIPQPRHLRRPPPAAAILFLLPSLAASWLAMMVLHELGHILHALWSGGGVERVVLHPLAFSRTDLAPNPRPLLAAWGGVLWGSLIPLALCGIPKLRRASLGFLLRFFAGFCLIANGAYLASGIIEPVGDTADMLRLGTPAWVLPLAGLPPLCGGLALWSGLGPRFGFAKGAPFSPDPLAIGAVLATLAILVVAMLLLSA